MSRAERRRRAPDVAASVPLFSERLSSALDAILRGEAPNVGRFCAHCYTPMDPQRPQCPHCGRSVRNYAPVERVPDGVFRMYRGLRRRESLVVNGFAYGGLLLAVLIFIGLFAIIFYSGAGIWWYVIDIALLFVLSRVLAGLLGGIVGDELGYRYARRKLVEDWAAYAAARGEVAGSGDL